MATGASTANVCAADVPPPGPPVTTVMASLPVVTRSAAGTIAVSVVALPKVVASGVPLKSATDPLTNPVPGHGDRCVPGPDAGRGRAEAGQRRGRLRVRLDDGEGVRRRRAEGGVGAGQAQGQRQRPVARAVVGRQRAGDVLDRPSDRERQRAGGEADVVGDGRRVAAGRERHGHGGAEFADRAAAGVGGVEVAGGVERQPVRPAKPGGKRAGRGPGRHLADRASGRTAEAAANDRDVEIAGRVERQPDPVQGSCVGESADDAAGRHLVHRTE